MNGALSLSVTNIRGAVLDRVSAAVLAASAVLSWDAERPVRPRFAGAAHGESSGAAARGFNRARVLAGISLAVAAATAAGLAVGRFGAEVLIVVAAMAGVMGAAAHMRVSGILVQGQWVLDKPGRIAAARSPSSAAAASPGLMSTWPGPVFGTSRRGLAAGLYVRIVEVP